MIFILLAARSSNTSRIQLLSDISNRKHLDSPMGNGCVVNWEKVPQAGIYYCLCADHALRGICLHILLWLVTKGIITPPPKWSAVRVGGPNSKGRDRHYVDGSALLRDQQPSLHARAKVAKGLPAYHLCVRARFKARFIVDISTTKPPADKVSS
jgi:hypothetical protein